MGMIFTKNFFLKSSLLFREIFWLDCILSGFNTLMPSRYYFPLQRYYIYGMFLRKSIVDFLQKFFGLIVFSQAFPTYTNSKSLYRACCYIGISRIGIFHHMIFSEILFPNHQCSLVNFFDFLIFPQGVV